MEIEYTLAGTRGTVRCAAPLILEESSDVTFRFSNLREATRYLLSVSGKFYELDGNAVTLARSRLKKGVLRPELLEFSPGGAIAGKYFLTPIHVISVLTEIRDKLVAYPETDDLLARLAEAEEAVAALKKTVEDLEKISVDLTCKLAAQTERLNKAEANLKEINKYAEDPLGGR